MSQSYASAGIAAEVGLRQIVTFTADGTFTKATYPWLKRVRVVMVGAGAGGSGATSTSGGEMSIGGGGGGGAYAESLIEESALGASETVTVGEGGAGGSGAVGSDGEDTSFGSLVIADAGAAGLLRAAQSTVPEGIQGGVGGLASASTGDIVLDGGFGALGDAATLTDAFRHTGGTTALSPGTAARFSGSGSSAGSVGKNYGGGGEGGWNSPSQSVNVGGDGADGIVICYLYG